MGQRGPQRQPAEILELRGRRPGARLPVKRPSRPLAGEMVKPKDLIPGAARIWDQVVREMRPTGVLRPAHGWALRVFCETAARYVKNVKALAKEGELVEGRLGGPVKNPRAQLVRDCYEGMRTYAKELGLTPAALANLELPTIPGDEPAGPDRLLS